MMNRTISPQDIELLSAYLDRELSANQMAEVEVRLQTESELKDLFVELRRTRQVLRSLPVMRAPRNFTLTPEMAGIKPRRENRLVLWFNRLRLSSALAAILLVLVLMGDFLTGITPLPLAGRLATDSMPAEELSAAESLPEAAQSLQALEAPAGEDTERAIEAPAEEPQAEADGTGIAAEEENLPEPTPMPQRPPPFPFGGLGGGGGDEVPTGQPPPEPLLTTEQVRTVVRVSEIGLALAAIITALVAWLLRRRST